MKAKRMKKEAAKTIAQIDLLEEKILDSFAGGGGASTGIELATGRVVTWAINHDLDAIRQHKANHPYPTHYQASDWDLDPMEITKGQPVGLAWFSPDCKHFSKAKGKALRDRKIRGLAWIVLRWAGTVRPRVIMLENVEEFQTWGPVRKGKPVKKKAGQTFHKFIFQLQDLGYQVEYRELVAADYGAPTTRKRFVLVARCDGRPIVWPEPSHAPRDSEAVKSGRLKPWRSAAEIIDWSLPSYSIFDSKQEIKEKYGVNAVRPLADNTLRRAIRGADKFTIRSGSPFLMECNHGGDGHVRSVSEPVNTLTAKYTCGVVEPVMAAAQLMSIGQTGGGDRIRDMREPAPTTVSKQEACLVAANLIQYHTEQTENVRASGLNEPIATIDASNRHGLVSAQLVEYYGNGNPLSVREPMHTITAHDREALVSAHIQKFFGGVVGEDAREPLPTVTSVDHNALCAAHVVEFKGQDIGQSVEKPLRTISASAGEFAVCRAVVTKVENRDFGHWPQIRALLNRYCGYSLAEDEVILLVIHGIAYIIVDITLRMLTPRELYNAMGFPPDYIIDRDYEGKPYAKSAQVARCGNAVCPPLAEAMVRANLPEWCGEKITTMEQLESRVAV